MVPPFNIVRPENPHEEDEFLKELYKKSSVPVDQLAYTKDFEAIFQRFAERFDRPDSNEERREVLRRLMRLRKAGRLPRLREGGESSVAEF